MTGVVLLYVGVVLIVNGIWLIGQARAAAAATRMPGRDAAFAATPPDQTSTAAPRNTAEPAAAGRAPPAHSLPSPPRLPIIRTSLVCQERKRTGCGWRLHCGASKT